MHKGGRGGGNLDDSKSEVKYLSRRTAPSHMWISAETLRNIQTSRSNMSQTESVRLKWYLTFASAVVEERT